MRATCMGPDHACPELPLALLAPRAGPIPISCRRPSSPSAADHNSYELCDFSKLPTASILLPSASYGLGPAPFGHLKLLPSSSRPRTASSFPSPLGLGLLPSASYSLRPALLGRLKSLPSSPRPRTASSFPLPLDLGLLASASYDLGPAPLGRLKSLPSSPRLRMALDLLPPATSSRSRAPFGVGPTLLGHLKSLLSSPWPRTASSFPRPQRSRAPLGRLKSLLSSPRPRTASSSRAPLGLPPLASYSLGPASPRPRL